MAALSSCSAAGVQATADNFLPLLGTAVSSFLVSASWSHGYQVLEVNKALPSVHVCIPYLSIS